ncbi:hypothetical protein UlMin_038034 [Ulmus minor]
MIELQASGVPFFWNNRQDVCVIYSKIDRGVVNSEWWDVICLVRHFFLTGSLHPSLNSTNVVLVPTVPNPTNLGQYRPISVCNIVYKEVIHSMRKKRGRDGWMGLKVDIEKAYDKLNWSFIHSILTAFGFHQRLINWVTTCCSTMSMNVMLNGTFFQKNWLSRGLRQGDPLSPYLFIICMEVLFRLINQKVEEGNIKGFSVARGVSPIHHLYFVDDIFLLGKATRFATSHFKECLDTFCSWYGQSFNNHKSNIFFSKNMSGIVEGRLVRILAFERIPILIHYLGLPLFRSNRIRDFSFLVDKLDRKLVGWKFKLLPKTGRLLLIKAASMAIP